MKRFIFILTAIIICFNLNAQQATERTHRRFSPEDYKKMMEIFISKEAGLTKEEAQNFFPIFHEMQEKQRKINNEQMEVNKKSFGKDLTEKDYEEIIDKITTLEVENKKIEKEYYKKFHTVLSWKKIHRVYRALFKFNMETLRKFTPQGRPSDNKQQRRK
jgi:DNA-binding transcriptional MerR regulator